MNKKQTSMFQSHLYGIESGIYRRRSTKTRVSIAPLWNWKKWSVITCSAVLAFQSHLYGIERGQELSNLRFADRFNRTFMELKVLLIFAKEFQIPSFQSHLYGIESWKGFRKKNLLMGFNRTFMELKEERKYWILHGSKVSIAPLWNWKTCLEYLRKSDGSFNRTFMELKVVRMIWRLSWFGFQSHLYGIESHHKQDLAKDLRVSIAPLWNWKIAPRTEVAEEVFVSIAPLWNWKRPIPLKPSTMRLFQSHLYGIERAEGGHPCRGRCKFQSHLYGIERYSCVVERGRILVSIAPLWNWKLKGELVELWSM